MEYLFQFLIIAAVSFAGELLSLLIPLSVPGSVYGLLLMLALLATGAVKLRQVEKAADFLIRIMPVLFIGPNVSFLAVVGGVAGSLPAILAIALVTTVIVLAVTGWTAQAILRRREGKARE